MDIVGLWGQTIKDAINRFAKNEPRSSKEDYEQECLLVVLEIQDVLERITNTQGKVAANNYVYGTCQNRIQDLMKKSHKHTHSSLSDRRISHLVEERETVLDLPFEDHEIDEAIKQLSREEQHVVREIYFCGKTERDVAKSLNKPKTWVHSIKQEAISRLREYLQ